ncbi:MAG: riboflavin synthase [Sphingobacteriaceae bacterium]|nr:riboflavin synthase [Sphingobacteriaceae bacterium]
MFTGIIETFSKLEHIQKEGENIHFTFSSPIAQELKIDQSVAHNGVCLTITSLNQNLYTVTAIAETLQKSNLGELKEGDQVNIERCLQVNGRFDGHIVQGHVDTTAICKSISDQKGSKEFLFEYSADKGHITVEKGSITVNGVSLTVVKSLNTQFSVCLIPYTLTHTNFNNLQVGDQVNIEFDIIGKYLAKLASKN